MNPNFPDGQSAVAEEFQRERINPNSTAVPLSATGLSALLLFPFGKPFQSEISSGGSASFARGCRIAKT